MKKTCLLLVILIASGNAQTQHLSLSENFDRITAPLLPNGWRTSSNRSAMGDFITTSSSSRSQPNTLISTNATITQTLTSPVFDFTNLVPDKLELWISRSSTHTAPLLVEASLDSGRTYGIIVSDTLQNNGSSGYQQFSLTLPATFINQPAVSFRWRLIGNLSGGTTGTFRMDDITITISAMNDFALISLQAIPFFRLNGLQQQILDGYNIDATVKNVGRIAAARFAVQFFLDKNNNGRADTDEQFAQLDAGPLAIADTAIIEARLQSLTPGQHRCIAVLEYPPDGNSLNDTASVLITAGADPGSIIVNEIMFDPLEGQNEWIEFYNRSGTAIDVTQWKIAENSAGDQSVSQLSVQSNTIHPKEYLLLAADSTILLAFPYLRNPDSSIHLCIRNRSSGFNLNNSGDDLYLLDATNQVIDHLSYSPSWHYPDLIQTRGISLERISPEIHSTEKSNWSSSSSSLGGTPGKSNSILARALPSAATLSLHPNPFSPDNDGFEDHCIIQYRLPLKTSLLRIRVYDTQGRLIRRLSESALSGSTGEIIWDGFDDEKRRARIGPHIIFLEAIDSQGGMLATAKAVVVVATKF
ncbi:MAG: lamin tail domain-containing protein [bacterium]